MSAVAKYPPALIPALAVAALVALAALLLGGAAARAQGDDGLQVSITANPVDPQVSEATTLTATIANPPSEETPEYDWEIDFGSGWHSVSSGSAFRYGNAKAETLDFRVTVSYDSGETATSEPVAVTWTEPGEEPAPEPTEEPTPTPTPEPTPEPVTVSGVAVSSAPASGATYGLDEVIRITLTFSEAVEVAGSPQLAIDMDPADWGTKWAAYASGSGTSSLVFAHTVVEPNVSTQGIAVLADTLELNGGSIQSAVSQAAADLYHSGLAHDANHKVDWQQSAPEPANSPATGAPTITGTARVGETLTADTSGISDDDGLADATFSYQWLADDGDISGATGNTYTLAGADQGKAVRVRVSFTDDAGHGERLTSAATAAVEAAQPPEVSSVAVVSNPGDDATYGLNDVIRVTLTFTEAVEVTGAPRLKIDMDPAEWGEKWATYASGSGSGTESLTFAHTVVEPNISTQGIAVLANTLELNGGTIQSASSQTDADLSHAGLAHDASHQVDWRQSEPNLAPVVNTQAANYPGFVGQQNAPRGTLVSKPFAGLFSDPDGDNLTYSVSLASDNSRLVDELVIGAYGHSDEEAARSGHSLDVVLRVYFQAEAERDWKALNPQPPVRPVVTVTLTATDPGGLSASLDGDFLIWWETYPELESAVAGEQAITLTYDMAVLGDPGPTPGQFTVKVVNGDRTGGTVAVSRVSVNGPVVTLGLASALEVGQTVTLDYAEAADTPLRAANGWGDPAPWFRGQAVDTSRLGLPGEPENFAVSAEPGVLNLLTTWDAVAGATSYRLRWRQSGGEFEAANAVTVSKPIWGVTVSGYGQWEVRAQACNEADCGPEASSTVDVVPEASLRLARAVDAEGQLRPRTLTANWDPVPDAASYTLRWRPASESPPAPAQPDDNARQARSIGGRSANTQTSNQLTVPAGRTNAEFTVPDDRAYEVDLQARGDGDELIAMANRNVDQMPGQRDTTPPRLERGQIDGGTMTLHFSESLDEDSVGGYFVVMVSLSGGKWDYEHTRGRGMDISDNKVTARLGDLRAREGLRAYGQYIRRAGSTAKSLRDLAGNPVSVPSYPYQNGPWRSTGWRRLDNITGLTHVTGVTISSDAGADRLYLYGEIIRVKITFSEAVSVSGTPRLKIDLDRAGGGERWASYASGSGTKTLGFAYTVGEPDHSTQGVAVVRDTLELNGGAIRSTGTQKDVHLGHAWLSHDSDHQVDWRQSVPGIPRVTRVMISSDPGNDDTYAHGETVQVTVTYDQAVAVTGTPRLKIKLAPAYGEQWAHYASGSGTTTLTFAYTVVEPDRSTRGVAVLGNTLELNGGAIRSVATPQQNAHRWYAGLGHDADHLVDWQRSEAGAPWVVGVAITSDPGDNDIYTHGETIRVKATFSEAVNVDTAGGTPRLKIRMAPHLRWQDTDDAERWASYAGGSGTAELTFEYPVAAVNRSTYGVAVLGNTLELNGGTIRSMDTTPVNAHLRYEGLRHDPDHQVDGTSPALLGLAVSGVKVSVNFREVLDEESVPPVSAFTVKRTPQGGVEGTVDLSGAPVISGGAVILTLASAVVDTDTNVKVSYAKPTAASDSKLRDQAGNEAASFTDQEADATDTTPPRLVWGEINGDVMTIYFSEALDEDSVSSRVGDYFRINLFYASSWPQDGQCPGVNRTFTIFPREVIVSGNTVVVVGLSDSERTRANVRWTIINFYYIADTTVTNRLRDLSGNPVSTPGHRVGRFWETRLIRLDNVTQLPWPQSATVVGKQLTLTFSAPMDGGWVPAASAFTVKVNGTQVSLASANPVAVSGRDVTLTLAAAVASGDTVTVSYEKPDSNWLENVVCEYAPTFSDQAVTNSTP